MTCKARVNFDWILGTYACGEKLPCPKHAADVVEALAVEKLYNKTLQFQLDKKDEELEIERMRLAACGVAALGNTRNCIKQRITPDSPYYSASYQDICNAVDREIALAERLESLEPKSNPERCKELNKDFFGSYVCNKEIPCNEHVRVFVPTYFFSKSPVHMEYTQLCDEIIWNGDYTPTVRCYNKLPCEAHPFQLHDRLKGKK